MEERQGAATAGLDQCQCGRITGNHSVQEKWLQDTRLHRPSSATATHSHRAVREEGGTTRGEDMDSNTDSRRCLQHETLSAPVQVPFDRPRRHHRHGRLRYGTGSLRPHGVCHVFRGHGFVVGCGEWTESILRSSLRRPNGTNPESSAGPRGSEVSRGFDEWRMAKLIIPLPVLSTPWDS